ncbi:helix-turn-helix domain-containing protein [Desertivirga xinjiangensis]|uniref:helix-turn-helix domain-containing protein n=1 Tax=Desertivirga xinjiangensis TaxID=539206 RepID=UPI002109C789|nr:helix-turn-helix domain-containing protein [Pedobacter xinjiangensis]
MSHLLRITRQLHDTTETLHRMEKRLEAAEEYHKESLNLQKSQIIAQKPDRLLTAKQASLLINVDEKTVYNWGQNGTLPHTNIGRRKYYRESEVLKHKR